MTAQQNHRSSSAKEGSALVSMASPIKKVAVVGAGYMGRGIGQVLALAGAQCTFVDVDPPRSAAARAAVLEEIRRQEAAGLLAAGTAQRVEQSTRAVGTIADAVSDADFVIEAVFEDPSVKKPVLEAIEASARPDALLASNTSAIPISELAASLSRPERFFGVHWFNPAPLVPAVEIICGGRSDRELATRIVAFLEAAGKSPVVVADSPGFVCNRLQMALFREAALMVEERLATPAQIDQVVRGSFGFRLPFFGPFAIADMAGLDVYLAMFRTLEAANGARFSCPESLRSHVERGELGVKSGNGYLDLTPEKITGMLRSRDVSYSAMSRLLAELQKSDETAQIAKENQ